jgi:prepilin-type processing-associated H-X9-DG protein
VDFVNICLNYLLNIGFFEGILELMSFITSIATANPSNRFKQSDIADFMVKAMDLGPADARILRTLFRATGIETRCSVLADYGDAQGDSYFSNPDLSTPSTKARLVTYREKAVELSLESCQSCLQRSGVVASDVTHLVVVSCTGMYAPGLDIDLVHALGLPTSVERTCINFMGCYAAFNALKIANVICQGRADARVLVVCTELCSLHFQKVNTEDNFLANALFADGSAAVLVSGEAAKGINLVFESFFGDLAPAGANDMAWTVGDFGFEMKLTSYVPQFIQSGIKKLTERLLSQVAATPIDYYAIHPGGKRILEVIEQELGLSKTQNRFAYEVLRAFGNMSSPTVLFVLNRIMAQLGKQDHQKKILSFAFGPGLTMESMLLSIHHH